MSSRVGVTFDGNNGGVVRAAAGTVAAVQSVSKSVAASSVESARFSGVTRTAEADLGRFGRGALAGSGIMQGFGRSVAFASATFIGASGLIEVMRSAVDQAETLQKAHQSLETSVTRLGGNFKIAGGEIDTWAAKQQKFGVSITESEQGLSRLIPLTGSVTKGMEAYSLALELSKGDNISLTSAETAVAKALDGKTASLQRYGIVLNKNASDEQVAAAISARFGGQAIANTTTLDQLHATLQNVELTLGQDMLPTIEHVAGGLERWLGNQQNVNRITGDAKQVIGDTVAVTRTLYDIAEKVSGALGGWKNTLELLVGFKIATVIGGWTQGFGLMSGKLAGNVSLTEKLLANVRGLAAYAGVPIAITFDIVEIKRIVNDLFGSGTPTAGESQTVGARVHGQILTAVGGSGAAQLLQNYVNDPTSSSVLKQLSAAMSAGAFSNAAYASLKAADAANPGLSLLTKGTSPAGKLRSGYVTQADMESLLEQQGVPPGAAQILAGIAYKGESGGKTNARGVNTNGTVDYGLFQINSSHKPASMTEAQWEAYLSNPANNAKEAAGILSSQGFGAWTEKYGRAAAAEYPLGSDAWKMLMSGGYGGSIPVAAGGTTKTKKPHILTGAALIPSDLNDEISTLADKAKNAAGAAAIADLKAEEAAIEQAISDVGAKLKGASSKQAAAINAELTALSNKLRDLHAQIKDAAAAKEEQQTIAKFTDQLKAEQADQQRLVDKASLDATYSVRTNLAGATKTILEDYKSIGNNLADQSQTLTAEKGKLISQLAGAGPRTTSLIKTQVAKINNQLGSVQGAILANLKSEADTLQQTVNTISGKVATAWSRVQGDIIQEFEKQTSDYIQNVLGPQFFQGAQTPSEARLAAMQAQDQMDQLNASLASAQASGDQAQIAQAQRAIDEYNLSIEATQERAAADKAYAQAVQMYTDQRTVQEHKLAQALDVFGQGLADGAGNLAGLDDILATYGIPNMAGLSDVAGQLYQADFPALSSAVDELAAAMVQLAALIDQITGSPPPGPSPAGAVTPGSTTAYFPPTAGPALVPAHTSGGAYGFAGTFGFARGGKVPGRFIGRDSVPALLSPGETVIDRGLTAALEQLVVHGVGSTIHATVLGASEQQVGAALERLVTPAKRRVVTYPAPRL